MSKNSTSTMIVPTIWKRFPHRIKGFLKRDSFDPTSPPPPPPPPPTTTTTASPSKSSLIYRIFPSNHHNSKNKKRHINNNFIQLKNSQWATCTELNSSSDLDICSTEVPLRANLMSFFTTSTQQRRSYGWSTTATTTNTATDILDTVSRIYIGTLGKIRYLSHYTMEQQIAIHHLLIGIQNKTILQRHHVAGHHHHSKIITESILMNNRKPKRTRYIFMLISTPSSNVMNKIHPVTDAFSKLRKPFSETMTMITAEMIFEQEQVKKKELSTYKFVPADYLLDPATLRGTRTTTIIGSEPNSVVAQQQ